MTIEEINYDNMKDIIYSDSNDFDMMDVILALKDEILELKEELRRKR